MGQLSPVPFRTLSRVCDFPELRDALGGETYSQARMEKLGWGGLGGLFRFCYYGLNVTGAGDSERSWRGGL